MATPSFTLEKLRVQFMAEDEKLQAAVNAALQAKYAGDIPILNLRKITTPAGAAFGEQVDSDGWKICHISRSGQNLNRWKAIFRQFVPAKDTFTVCYIAFIGRLDLKASYTFPEAALFTGPFDVDGTNNLERFWEYMDSPKGEVALVTALS